MYTLLSLMFDVYNPFLRSLTEAQSVDCRVTCLVVSVQSVHLVPVHGDGVALALTHVPVTHLGIIIIIIIIIITIITWMQDRYSAISA